MIVEFNTSTLQPVFAVAGSDTDTFNQMDAIKPAGYSVQIIADDADVLNNATRLGLFIATVAGPTLTGVVRRYKVVLSIASSPIDMKDTPTIDVQLKDQLDVNLPQIETVTLSVDLGSLADATVTTDGTGHATTTYKPHKGTQAVITATVPDFLLGQLVVAISIPTSAAKQNWLEADDIKPGAVGTEKLDGSVDARFSANTNAAFVTEASLADIFSPTDAQCRPILVDDSSHFYVYGNIGGTLYLKKNEKNTGVEVGSFAFPAGDGLASYSPLAFDGKYIYAAYHVSGDANNPRIAKFNAATMDLIAEFDYSAAPKYYVYIPFWTGIPGKELFAYMHNTVSGKDVIQSIDPMSGVATILEIFPNVGAANQGWQLAMDRDHVYCPVDNISTPPTSRVWRYYKDGSPSDYITGFDGAPEIMSIATDGTYLYLSHRATFNTDIALQKITTDGRTLASLTGATLGRVFDIIFDGKNIWAVGSGPGVFSLVPNFIFKISPIDLTVLQVFDYSASPAGTTFRRLATDGQHLYLTNDI